MDTVIFRHFPVSPYDIIFKKMQQFTNERNKETADEVWLLEHEAVFTQGLAGKPEHLLQKGVQVQSAIPVIQSDRGGQVTYHGRGQLVLYVLMDLQRKNISVKSLVCGLEEIMIRFLAMQNILAQRKQGAPGVYIEDAKIGSIGLRIRRGCSYHGLSFNIDMDLRPFQCINPCGFPNLKVTQLKDWMRDGMGIASIADIQSQFCQHFTEIFAYNESVMST